MSTDPGAEFGDGSGRRLRDHAGRGAMWSIGAQWSIRASGFLTFIILGRLLAPEDFGAIALASTLVIILSSLADFGFAAYLVQADKPTQRDFSTAFWFSGGVGILLAVLLVATSVPLSAALGAPSVAPVLAAVALSVVLDSFKSVPTALLKRRFDFRSLAVRRMVAVVVGQVVAIVMALAGAGVWALVGQVWAVSLVSLAATWMVAGWTPSLQFSIPVARRIAGYGVHVLGSDLVWNGMQWVTDGLVSRFLGLQALGYLSMASRVVQMTVDVAAAAAQQVAVALFASVKHQRGRLSNAYLSGLGMALSVLVPALLSLALTAPLLVPGVLGAKWEPAVPVFQLLALGGVARAIGVLDLSVLLGIGRPRLLFGIRTFTAAVIVAVTAVTAQFDVVAVAGGIAAVSAMVAPVQMVLVTRAVGVSLTAVVRRVLSLLMVSAVSVAVGGGWMLLMADRAPGLVVAFSAIAIAALIQVILLRLTQRALWKQVMGMGATLTRRRGRAARSAGSSSVPEYDERGARMEPPRSGAGTP